MDELIELIVRGLIALFSSGGKPRNAPPPLPPGQWQGNQQQSQQSQQQQRQTQQQKRRVQPAYGATMRAPHAMRQQLAPQAKPQARQVTQTARAAQRYAVPAQRQRTAATGLRPGSAAGPRGGMPQAAPPRRIPAPLAPPAVPPAAARAAIRKPTADASAAAYALHGPQVAGINAKAIRDLFVSRPSALRTTYVLSEILKPPLALRENGNP